MIRFALSGALAAVLFLPAFLLPALLLPARALCLPFNQDMVGGQLIAGSVMRPAADGAVPSGLAYRQLSKREDAKGMINPYSKLAGASKRELDDSVRRGERLFQQQCTVCHGAYQGGKHIPSDVNLLQWGIVSFNLLLTSPKFEASKTDDYIFGYIYHGAMVVMPAYGWKLSHSEIWDLVNYVRKVQAEAP